MESAKEDAARAWQFRPALNQVRTFRKLDSEMNGQFANKSYQVGQVAGSHQKPNGRIYNQCCDISPKKN
jgi:hypothetical protein